MKFLHSKVDVGPNESVRVVLSGTEANIEILDWANFTRFKKGANHHYYGGHYRRSPVIIKPPAGTWYVVVHLGGHGGTVDASVSVVPD